jgi:hypothetical protein
LVYSDSPYPADAAKEPVVDSDQFDRMTKSLGGGTNRRRVLAALLGGAAWAIGALTNESQSKNRRNRKKRCIKNTPAFGTPKRRCNSSKPCCGPGSCCNTGEAVGCFNLLNNDSFCGKSCADSENCSNTGKVCVNGKCVNP